VRAIICIFTLFIDQNTNKRELPQLFKYFPNKQGAAILSGYL